MAGLPKLFIGSSTAALDGGIVEAFCDSLHDLATCVPWKNEREFGKGSRSTLQALTSAANKYDFAIFLFTPDDRLIKVDPSTKKEVEFTCPRDNVVFEFGLFLSLLGESRVYSYLQKTDKPLWVLSDLNGITMDRFEFPKGDRDLQSANVRSAVKGLRENIQTNKFRSMFLSIASSWKLEDGAFTVSLDPNRARQANIDDYQACVVARKHIEKTHFKEDKNVFKSEARRIRTDVIEPTIVACPGFGPKPPKNVLLEACLLLLPPNVTPNDFASIDEAKSLGCRDVHYPSLRH